MLDSGSKAGALELALALLNYPDFAITQAQFIYANAKYIFNHQLS